MADNACEDHAVSALIGERHFTPLLSLRAEKSLARWNSLSDVGEVREAFGLLRCFLPVGFAYS